jgi:hypothetical protein
VRRRERLSERRETFGRIELRPRAREPDSVRELTRLVIDDERVPARRLDELFERKVRRLFAHRRLALNLPEVRQRALDGITQHGENLRARRQHRAHFVGQVPCQETDVLQLSRVDAYEVVEEHRPRALDRARQ